MMSKRSKLSGADAIARLAGLNRQHANQSSPSAVAPPPSPIPIQQQSPPPVDVREKQQPPQKKEEEAPAPRQPPSAQDVLSQSLMCRRSGMSKVKGGLALLEMRMDVDAQRVFRELARRLFPAASRKRTPRFINASDECKLGTLCETIVKTALATNMDGGGNICVVVAPWEPQLKELCTYLEKPDNFIVKHKLPVWIIADEKGQMYDDPCMSRLRKIVEMQKGCVVALHPDNGLRNLCKLVVEAVLPDAEQFIATRRLWMLELESTAPTCLFMEQQVRLEMLLLRPLDQQQPQQQQQQQQQQFADHADVVVPRKEWLQNRFSEHLCKKEETTVPVADLDAQRQRLFILHGTAPYLFNSRRLQSVLDTLAFVHDNVNSKDPEENFRIPEETDFLLNHVVAATAGAGGQRPRPGDITDAYYKHLKATRDARSTLMLSPMKFVSSSKRKKSNIDDSIDPIPFFLPHFPISN